MVVARQTTPEIWQMISTIAESAFKSRKLGVNSQAEAAMKMLAGHEIGLPAVASLRAIYIIQDKATIAPKAAWGLIVGHPDCDLAGFREERLTDDKGQFMGYTITLKRKSGLTARRQFTLADAKRAGLQDKDNWRAYPENLCYWRAMGFVQDVVFPDVTMGLYRADELGAAITPDGDVIDGEWATVPETPPATPQATRPTLDDLVTYYGGEAVLAASEGNLSMTPEELATVAAKLAASAGPQEAAAPAQDILV